MELQSRAVASLTAIAGDRDGQILSTSQIHMPDITVFKIHPRIPYCDGIGRCGDTSPRLGEVVTIYLAYLVTCWTQRSSSGPHVPVCGTELDGVWTGGRTPVTVCGSELDGCGLAAWRRTGPASGPSAEIAVLRRRPAGIRTARAIPGHLWKNRAECRTVGS